MDNTITTPEEEVKETEVETEEETESTDEPEESKVETIADLLTEEKDDRVPLKTFLETKKEKKALEREISELKEQAKKGATKTEINSDLKSIAEKYDVDANFLEELSASIYSKAKEEAETAIKPILEEKSREKIDIALMESINKALETMPEYEGVANKEVLKSLSKIPENRNKTFQQIIEETYSKTVTGKRTMETSTPRGGKEGSYDEERMRTDPQYFSEVMASPELKKKYNDSLVGRLKL